MPAKSLGRESLTCRSVLVGVRLFMDPRVPEGVSGRRTDEITATVSCVPAFIRDDVGPRRPLSP